MMAATNEPRVHGLRRDARLAPLHPRARDIRAIPTKDESVNHSPRSSSDECDDTAETASKDNVDKTVTPSQTRKRPASVAAKDDTWNLISAKHVLKTTYSRGKAKPIGHNLSKKKFRIDSSEPQVANEDSPNGSSGKRRASFKPPPEVAKATFRPPPSVEAPPRPELKVPPPLERSRPVFRMPSAPTALLPGLPSTDHGSTSSITQSPSVSTVIASSSPNDDVPSSNTAGTLLNEDVSSSAPESALDQCPICRTTVSPESLSALRRSLSAARLHDRSRFNQQAAFCRSHREATGRDEWKRRGYPMIDWTELPARLELHRSKMLAILKGTRSSVYKDELEEKLAARRANGEHSRETLAKEFTREGDGAETVGYYGGRGAGIMMNWLAKSLAKPLRKAQGKDPLIQACGSVSAFVQRVLVPELAMLLVEEDIRAAAADFSGSPPVKKRKKKKDGIERHKGKDAHSLLDPPQNKSADVRERLKEGADLGRLLCQEIDDEIVGEDGEGDLVAENNSTGNISQQSEDDEDDESEHDI